MLRELAQYPVLWLMAAAMAVCMLVVLTRFPVVLAAVLTGAVIASINLLA